MTPATAFAPGSPAGGLPSFETSSRSGDIGQTLGFDNSGFNVNFGTSLGQGGAAAAVPWWVWAGVLLGGLLWIKKKST
jgi:hypothetical protein